MYEMALFQNEYYLKEKIQDQVIHEFQKQINLNDFEMDLDQRWASISFLYKQLTENLCSKWWDGLTESNSVVFKMYSLSDFKNIAKLIKSPWVYFKSLAIRNFPGISVPISHLFKNNMTGLNELHLNNFCISKKSLWKLLHAFCHWKLIKFAVWTFYGSNEEFVVNHKTQFRTEDIQFFRTSLSYDECEALWQVLASNTSLQKESKLTRYDGYKKKVFSICSKGITDSI